VQDVKERVGLKEWYVGIESVDERRKRILSYIIAINFL
jgi:hypothetical protein